MKLTEHQEEIYLRHVELLKQYTQPAYSERAVRELENSYHLYCELKNQTVEDYICTKEEVWQELANLPIDDDLIANMVEEIERKLHYQMKDYNTLMQLVIRLQIILEVPIKKQYYSIFLTFFDALYLQVISKRYHDCYGQEASKVKRIGEVYL